MHKKNLILFLWIPFFIFVHINSANAQSLDTYFSHDSLRAGDIGYFSITLTRSGSYDEIILPDSTYFGQSFEVRRRRLYRVSGMKDSIVYRLQFWGVNDAKIPSLPVKIVAGGDTATLFTQPVSVAFHSVLQSRQPTLRPLKPIFEFARAWWLYGLILLLLILAAAAGYYYYMKWERQPEPEPREFKPEPFLNPLRELENNLRQLEPVLDSNNINFKQFYIDLGDAIRLYFEQMYHMPALESTSREIIHELKRRAVDQAIVDDTRAVLNEADMVKFAKFKPSKEQAKKAFDKAENFQTTVKDQHRNRIKMMRKQHFKEVEQERKAFQQEQKEAV